ncbi:MAG: efflux RND transporter permease subunit [Gemmatimonadetes bacterium]|nr:efflux RND transporter permease subunit [Gemmatimonadota bacterium]
MKGFRLTTLAVDHPTTVLVLTAIIIVAGLVSYFSIPKESMPEITVPFVAVNTVYSGVAPEDMETLITRPLEEDLNEIADAEEIQSTSVEGYSSIVIEFRAGMDMTEALQLVREKVDIAKPDLPSAAEEPTIVEFNLSEFPIMQVNVSGEYSLRRLKEVAERLQDRLELIPSILEVTLSGGLEREVQVNVDLAKLQFYRLAFDDVMDAIREENLTIPGGTIDVGEREYLVRVPGEFEDTRLIADIVIASPNDRPVYVRDVAEVEFGFKERESYARLDGNPVVTLGIVKRTGENIIETSDAVKRVIQEAQARFPPTTVVKITSDQSEDIRKMVSNLENNIISGLILVVAVLLFFLGIANASFVGIAIPLSMLLSFSIMQLIGFTMNMVVLFSLILALGMLVDNAIVVVENIFRFLEQGYDRKEAAKLATAEVAMPVIAATATTLAAFAPMAFWPGLIGEFMAYLPLTLIITLSASLFVALVVNPTICSLFMRLDGDRAPGLTPAARWSLIGIAGLAFTVVFAMRPLTAVLLTLTAGLLWALHRWALYPGGRWFQHTAFPAVLRRYERFLRWALAHRARVMGATAGVLVASVWAFAAFNAGIEFFPEDIPPETVYVQVEMPPGTRADATDRVVRQIERELAALPAQADFQSVVATVGSGGDGGSRSGANEGTVAVNFVDFELRERDSFETLELMRSTVGRRIAGAEITVEKPQNGPGSGPPISVEIAGEDDEVLERLADEAYRTLANAPVARKLEGLDSDIADARPELRIEVDRERARLFDLSTAEVGATVRSAINGTEVSKFRFGEEEYDIVVRLAPRYREDLDALADLMIVTEDGDQVPLSSLATWRVDESYSGINRKNLERVATISADVRSTYNANRVLEEVRTELAGFAQSLPAGYTLQYTGQQEDQAESEAFLFGAFLIALMLIALILVSQFDSVVRPLIILSSVLLSTAGVLIGLLVFRMPFGIIMTGVGVISLAGVVVNNAIILVDYIGVLRKRDGIEAHESLVVGGMTRFRPVTLTAVTTVLGLTPLAIGLNFDFAGLFTRLSPNLFWGGEQAAWWGPMAIAVIAGLTFATFLTLVLVPVMHSLTDDLTTFLDRHLRRSEVESPDESGSSDERGAGSREPEGRPEEREPELVTA